MNSKIPLKKQTLKFEYYKKITVEMIDFILEK